MLSYVKDEIFITSVTDIFTAILLEMGQVLVLYQALMRQNCRLYGK